MTLKQWLLITRAFELATSKSITEIKLSDLKITKVIDVVNHNTTKFIVLYKDKEIEVSTKGE